MTSITVTFMFHNFVSSLARSMFIYFSSNISSAESDINILISKAWSAIERLTIICKSDLLIK